MKISKLLYWLLVIILSITMLFSGSIVIRYIVDAVQQKKEYDALAAMVEQARAETVIQPTTAPTISAAIPEPTQEAYPCESESQKSDRSLSAQES